MQNISTGEVVAAYNFTSQTNNLVERVKRLELANWRWFPVWSSDRHRQMALASRGHFLLLADRRQMKGAQSDARLRFRKRNDTKAMNEWMCRPHQIPPPSAKQKRSVSRSLRPFGTRAKKKQMKEDHSGNNEKDPKLAILELLAASPSLWPVWKMDVDGCSVVDRMCHH